MLAQLLYSVLNYSNWTVVTVVHFHIALITALCSITYW